MTPSNWVLVMASFVTSPLLPSGWELIVQLLSRLLEADMRRRSIYRGGSDLLPNGAPKEGDNKEEDASAEQVAFQDSPLYRYRTQLVREEILKRRNSGKEQTMRFRHNNACNNTRNRSPSSVLRF